MTLKIWSIAIRPGLIVVDQPVATSDEGDSYSYRSWRMYPLYSGSKGARAWGIRIGSQVHTNCVNHKHGKIRVPRRAFTLHSNTVWLLTGLVYSWVSISMMPERIPTGSQLRRPRNHCAKELGHFRGEAGMNHLGPVTDENRGSSSIHNYSQYGNCET
jgi:hypothetical protein